MARNGTTTLASAATTKARTPDELYDTLGEAGQALWDNIGQLGFRPDKGEGGWYALSINGDDKVGPCESLSVLHQEVTRHTAQPEPLTEPPGTEEPEPEKKGKVVKLNANTKGQKYFDGMQPEVDPDLKRAALEEYADKQAWNEAGKKKKVSKVALEAIVRTKKHLFKPDPDNSDKLIYSVGDIDIEMAKDVSVTVKTRRRGEQSEDEE